METKNETKVTFDDRRKELKHEILTVEDIKNPEGKVTGQLTTNMVGIYKEEGIRNVYKSIHADKANCEQNLKRIKESIDSFKEIEGDDDVKKFMETQKKVSILNQKKKLEGEREQFEEELKFANKNLHEIKQAIGDRLKL